MKEFLDKQLYRGNFYGKYYCKFHVGKSSCLMEIDDFFFDEIMQNNIKFSNYLPKVSVMNLVSGIIDLHNLDCDLSTNFRSLNRKWNFILLFYFATIAIIADLKIAKYLIRLY